MEQEETKSHSPPPVVEEEEEEVVTKHPTNSKREFSRTKDVEEEDEPKPLKSEVANKPGKRSAAHAELVPADAGQASQQSLEELEKEEQNAKALVEEAKQEIERLRTMQGDGIAVEFETIMQAELRIERAQLTYKNATTKLSQFRREHNVTTSSSGNVTKEPSPVVSIHPELQKLQTIELQAEQAVESAEQEYEALRAQTDVDPIVLKKASTNKKRAQLVYANAVSKIIEYQNRVASQPAREVVPVVVVDHKEGGAAIQEQVVSSQTAVLTEMQEESKDDRDSMESESNEPPSAALDRLSRFLGGFRVAEPQAYSSQLQQLEQAESLAERLITHFEETLQALQISGNGTEKELRLLLRQKKKAQYIHANLYLHSDTLRTLVEESLLQKKSEAGPSGAKEEEEEVLPRKQDPTVSEAKEVPRLLVTMDIMPLNDFIDCQLLAAAIKSQKLPGVYKWLDNHKMIDIGFGVEKLNITVALITGDTNADDLCDTLSEQFAGDIREIIVVEEKVWFEA